MLQKFLFALNAVEHQYIDDQQRKIENRGGPHPSDRGLIGLRF
jgi:hypothetical protein